MDCASRFNGDVPRLTAPSGKTRSLCSAAGDEWGEYIGRLNPSEQCKHQVSLTCKQTNSTLEASFFVQG